MKYLDFEVQVSLADDGSCWIEVVDSPAGEVEARVQPLSDLVFVDRLREIDQKRRSATTRSGPATREVIVDRDEERRIAGSAKDLGRALFDFLLPDEVLSVYRSSLVAARQDGLGLRIRLRFQEPSLAALPWEFMHDGTEGDHICLDPETPLVRHLELARAHEPLTVTPPLRILGMISSPRGHPQLDVERERTDMTAALQHLVDAGYAHVEWVKGETWRALHTATLENEFNVFHFIGHGGFDPESGEGLIALTDDRGEIDPVSATRLGRMLAGRTRLRLAVLNSCEGGRSNEGDLFSSVAARLIREGIPAVVSMQYEITDSAALEFSRTFYDALVRRLPVDAAVTEARKAIALASEHTVEFATPLLHMRSPDGNLFEIDVASAVFGPKGGAEEAVEVQAPVAPLRAVPAAARPEREHDHTHHHASEDRGPLLVLLRKTRRNWIDDVLKQCLEDSGLIELHLESAETMVESPWGTIEVRPGQTIADVFEETGGCFLILGVPGVGKTTTMLMLAQQLLDRAESDPTRQVPVVLNLSSMRDEDTLEEWLASELGSKYQIPRRISRGWIDAGRLMLFLDGLDEVSDERRARCVETINTFMARGPGLNIVVCCRFNEYTQLPVRLKLNGAVRVQTLTREQVLAHVRSRGPSWAALLHALERDTSLQMLARTPFMLSLMLRTYRDVPVATAEGFASIESRKDQLMEAYVTRQFRNAATAALEGVGP